jgi:hypothetical protein
MRAADSSSVRISRGRNAVAAAVMTLALLGVFGPHLAILGYKVAGARPPAALTFICPLHHAAGAATGPGRSPS